MDPRRRHLLGFMTKVDEVEAALIRQTYIAWYSKTEEGGAWDDPGVAAAADVDVELIEFLESKEA